MKSRLLLLLCSFLLFAIVASQIAIYEANAMFALRNSLNLPDALSWSDRDPCTWNRVFCNQNRVIWIQIGNLNLSGTLPKELSDLVFLERLELQWNSISGPLPILRGLASLQILILSHNRFDSIPDDFFTGMSSIETVAIDNNPFSTWELPKTLSMPSPLRNFSANSANLVGSIPALLTSNMLPNLRILHLDFNSLEGELPESFSYSQIVSLSLNKNKLNGTINVIQNMTFLTELSLQFNEFTGALPDFSELRSLNVLNLKSNWFTGPIPASLVKLESIQVVDLNSNLLQGPMPKFKSNISVDMVINSNRFCLPQPGECDPRVDTLLSIVKSMDYPTTLAYNWKGNDPCNGWLGINCSNGNIIIVSFNSMGLTGTISPQFGSLKSLQALFLAHNELTGAIPKEIAALPELVVFDVSFNRLSAGIVPKFRGNVNVVIDGNPDLIGADADAETNPIIKGKSQKRIGIIVALVIGGVFVVCLIGTVVFYLYKSRQKRFVRVESRAKRIPSHHPGSYNDNMVISIQVLKKATNNFCEDNILGEGGFGTVYEGDLHNGTKIAVKRMKCGGTTGKGAVEFKSEIAVLNKVRHRHLVALLGYCLDENEKLLVYEYMPQGTLNKHLFQWANEGLQPMEWMTRLIIALDVARGVEYLHGLAHQSFIHRDLKPSNILLRDDLRAKVADFGFVKLVPEGNSSIETRIAGTFGYLAPEYAVMGRVTTKVDVYSFGVILMTLITGRKAVDVSQAEENMHLVTWFRRMYINEDTFRMAIDPAIDLNEEIQASIRTVAELAYHCCAKKPCERPDMGYAVSMLSSLAELWKPSDQGSKDIYGIDLETVDESSSSLMNQGSQDTQQQQGKETID